MKKPARPKEAIPGADLEAVYNRNEKRIIKALKQVLAELTEPLSPKAIQDIYALALNKIPAHYVHRGTIVLRANVRNAVILDAIRESIPQVRMIEKV